MKILFTIVVLIAGVYLILPKDELKKLSSFLPQNQIEQAAGVVLSDVDQKLEQFKVKFLVDKNSRISELEKKLTTLQTQLITQKEQLAELQINKQVYEQASKQFPVEYSLVEQSPTPQVLAQNQTVIEEPLSTYSKKVVTKNSDHSIKESDKQEAIKRQAYLQDLVERMNKTSLITLTN
jgi:hypothetical protein